MPVIRLSPDAILSQTLLSGGVGNIQDDPDSPDGLWLTAPGSNNSTEVRVSFPTPSGGPTAGAGLQEFRVLVRKTNHSTDPMATVEVYENGSLVATLVSSVTVSSTTGTVLSGTWDSSILGTQNGSLVECRVVGGTGSGSPNNRASLEVGAIEWNANVTFPAQNVTAPLFSSAKSFPSATVALGPAPSTVAPGLFTKQPTLPAPSVVPGAVSVSIPLHSDTESIYSPSVDQILGISPDRLDGGASHLSPEAAYFVPPFFVAASGTASSTGGTIAIWPPVYQTGDLGVLTVVSRGDGSDAIVSEGWTAFPGSPVVDVPTSSGVKIQNFYKFAKSNSEPFALVQDTGAFTGVGITAYRRIKPVQTVVDSSSASNSGAEVDWPTVVTSAHGEMILFFGGYPGLVSATLPPNTGLTELATRLQSSALPQFGDGICDVISAVKSSPGATPTGPSSRTAALVVALAVPLEGEVYAFPVQSASSPVEGASLFSESYVSPSAHQSAPEIYGADISALGLDTVHPSLHSDDDTIYSSSAVAANSVSTGLHEDPDSHYPVSVSPSNILSIDRFDSVNEFFVGLIESNYPIESVFLPDSDTFLSGSLVSDFYVSAPHLDDGGDPALPTVLSTSEIDTARIEESASFYGYAINAYYTISPDITPDDELVYSAEVSLLGAPKEIQPSFYIDDDVLFLPSSVADNHVSAPWATTGDIHYTASVASYNNISPALHETALSVFSVVAQSSYSVSVNQVDWSPGFLSVTIENEYSISASLLQDADTLYAAALSTDYGIVAGLADYGPSLFSPDSVSEYALLTPLLAPSDLLYGPLLGGSYSIAQTETIDDTGALYAAVIGSAGGVYPDRYTDTEVFQSASLSSDYQVYGLLQEDNETIPAPSLLSVYGISTERQDQNTILPTPSVGSDHPILAQSLLDTDWFHTIAVDAAGSQSVLPITVDPASSVYPPAAGSLISMSFDKLDFPASVQEPSASHLYNILASVHGDPWNVLPPSMGSQYWVSASAQTHYPTQYAAFLISEWQMSPELLSTPTQQIPPILAYYVSLLVEVLVDQESWPSFSVQNSESNILPETVQALSSLYPPSFLEAVYATIAIRSSVHERILSSVGVDRECSVLPRTKEHKSTEILRGAEAKSHARSAVSEVRNN